MAGYTAGMCTDGQQVFGQLIFKVKSKVAVSEMIIENAKRKKELTTFLRSNTVSNQEIFIKISQIFYFLGLIETG